MIVITGSAAAKSGAFARLKAAGLAHSERSRREYGCLSHPPYVDAAEPERLFFDEDWRDLAAVEAHFRHPDTSAVLAAIHEHAATSEGPTLLDATPLRR